MFKRNFKVILIMILLLTLVGCQVQKEKANKLDEDVEVEAEVEEDEKLGKTKKKFINYELIDEERAYNVVKELTSKKYNGRLIGTKGHDLAKEYIKKRYEEISLQKIQDGNTYFQNYGQYVVLQNSETIMNGLNSNDEVVKEFIPYRNFRDLTGYSKTRIKGEFSGKVLFIDNLRQLEDQENDLKDKILIVSHDVLGDGHFRNFIFKVVNLDIKPKAVLIQYDNRKKGVYYKSTTLVGDVKSEGFNNKNGPATFLISNEMYSFLKDPNNRINQLKVKLDYSYENVQGTNIIGKIEGVSDSPENIIIAAHYDHVGNNFDGTYNPGALDNASGIAAMLEIGKVLKKYEGTLENNYIFLAHDGEEESLKGLKYYVDNPTVSMENTTIINLDMVGSTKDLPLFIYDYLVSHGDVKEQLKNISEDMKIESQMNKDGAGVGYKTLDQNNVPTVLLLNFDDEILHTRFDTAEQVNDKKLAEVIKLVLKWIENYKG